MDRGRRSRHGELSPRRVRLFLDTSVLLAACASERGASREIFRRCRAQGWRLFSLMVVVSDNSREYTPEG